MACARCGLAYFWSYRRAFHVAEQQHHSRHDSAPRARPAARHDSTQRPPSLVHPSFCAARPGLQRQHWRHGYARGQPARPMPFLRLKRASALHKGFKLAAYGCRHATAHVGSAVRRVRPTARSHCPRPNSRRTHDAFCVGAATSAHHSYFCADGIGLGFWRPFGLSEKRPNSPRAHPQTNPPHRSRSGR